MRSKFLKVKKNQKTFRYHKSDISGNTLTKKLYLHDISIHTDFHQNRSINECARMILALL